jgi:hypothetical protein
MTYDKTITTRVEFVSTLTERKAYEPNWK